MHIQFSKFNLVRRPKTETGRGQNIPSSVSTLRADFSTLIFLADLKRETRDGQYIPHLFPQSEAKSSPFRSERVIKMSQYCPSPKNMPTSPPFLAYNMKRAINILGSKRLMEYIST
jgi:hypothetical protein